MNDPSSCSPLMPDSAELLMLVDPNHYRQQQQKHQRRRRPRSSSAATASPPRAMIAALTIRQSGSGDQSHGHLKLTKSYDGTTTTKTKTTRSTSSRQLQNHSQPREREERPSNSYNSSGSRPDPPASLAAARRPLRHSRRNHRAIVPTTKETARSPPATRQLMIMPDPSREPRRKTERGEPTAAGSLREHPHHQHRRRHYQQRRAERRLSQSMREDDRLEKSVHSIEDKPKSVPGSPIPSLDEGSFVTVAPPAARTDSQHRRAEELDDFDPFKPRQVQPRPKEIEEKPRTRPRKPAKSSSFQSHPYQLLQVYKDLARQKEQVDSSSDIHFPNLRDNDGNGSSNKDISLQSCRNDVVRSKKENVQFKCSLLAASCSSSETVPPIYESDGDQESSSPEDSLGDDNSLTVQQDEDFSQDYIGGTKVSFKNTHHRQGSIEGQNTLATVASTASIASDLRSSMMTADQGLVDSCHTHHAEEEDEYYKAVVDAVRAGGDLEEGAGSDIKGPSGAQKSSKNEELSSSIKSLSFPTSIDKKLLQKQLKYLRNDDHNESNTFNESNVSLSPPPVIKKNLIILNHHHQPTPATSSVHFIEQTFRDIRKRRDIVHNGRKPKSDRGRRLSF